MLAPQGRSDDRSSRGSRTSLTARRWTTALISASALLAACAPREQHPVEPIPPLARDSLRVLVVRSPGVDGSPPDTVLRLPRGARLAYAFRTAAGYGRLEVRAAGVAVTAVGTIVVNDSTILAATAVPDIPATLTPPPEAMNRLRDAADVNAEMARQFDELYNYLRTKPASERAKALSALAAQPVPPLPPDVRRRIDSTLALRSLSIPIQATSQSTSHFMVGAAHRDAGSRAMHATISSRAPAAPVTPNGRRGTVLFFVNGIANTMMDANISFVQFIDAITAPPSRWSTMSGAYVHYRRRYNPTYSAITNPDAICAVSNWYSFAGIMAKCPSRIPGMPSVFYDLLQAAGQVAAGVVGEFQLDRVPAFATPFAASLEREVRAVLDSGRAVLLVGHSQGNLMIDEVLKNVPSHERVGHLRIAAPIRLSSPLDALNQRSGMIASGARSEDILQFLPGPKDSPIGTDATSRADAWLLPIGALTPPVVSSAARLTWDFYIHAFENYATDPTAGPRMRDDLTQIDDLAATGCDVVPSTDPTLVALLDAECRLTYNMSNNVVALDLSVALSQLIASLRATGAVNRGLLAAAHAALAQARAVLRQSDAPDLSAIELALASAAAHP